MSYIYSNQQWPVNTIHIRESKTCHEIFQNQFFTIIQLLPNFFNLIVSAYN